MRKTGYVFEKSYAQLESDFGSDTLGKVRKVLVCRQVLVCLFVGKILNEFLCHSSPETREKYK